MDVWSTVQQPFNSPSNSQVFLFRLFCFFRAEARATGQRRAFGQYMEGHREGEAGKQKAVCPAEQPRDEGGMAVIRLISAQKSLSKHACTTTPPEH